MPRGFVRLVAVRMEQGEEFGVGWIPVVEIVGFDPDL